MKSNCAIGENVYDPVKKTWQDRGTLKDGHSADGCMIIFRSLDKLGFTSGVRIDLDVYEKAKYKFGDNTNEYDKCYKMENGGLACICNTGHDCHLDARRWMDKAGAGISKLPKGFVKNPSYEANYTCLHWLHLYLIIAGCATPSAFGICIIVCWFCCCRKKKQQQQDPSELESSNSSHSP